MSATPTPAPGVYSPAQVSAQVKPPKFVLPPANKRELAIAAAQQATEATVVLLRFAREGGPDDTDLEGDTIERLADALKMALEIDDQPTGDADYDELRDRLRHAAANFVEGWA